MIEIGDRVEVLLNGQWEEGKVHSGSGQLLYIEIEGSDMPLLAYGDPEQVPGAGEFLRTAASRDEAQVASAEEDQLEKCRAGKCPVPPVSEWVKVKLWYCPTCRKRWRQTAHGSWKLVDSFKLTAEQEADVEQLATGGAGAEPLSWLAELMTELEELMRGRHQKYGAGNIAEWGDLGVVVRLSDKMARLRTTYQSDVSDGHLDETIEDTLKDIANYAIIALAWRRGLWPGSPKDTPQAEHHPE